MIRYPISLGMQTWNFDESSDSDESHETFELESQSGSLPEQRGRFVYHALTTALFYAALRPTEETRLEQAGF